MIRKRWFMALAVAAASCTGESAPVDDSGPRDSVDTDVSAVAVPPGVSNIVRLLEQMTFGVRPAVPGQAVPRESIEHVQSIGVGAAIIEQLNTSSGAFEPTPPRLPPCNESFPPELDPGAQFFVDALTAPDQLRLRTAFALSQILVVSANGIGENGNTCNSERRDAMVRYFNALRRGAFGNYRTLLEEITLEPAMGTFLDMANNVGLSATGPITANENFARELLQLFTLGTYRLNDRGERILVGGNPVPVYTETQVKAFAATFTGWTYSTPQGCPAAVGGKRTAAYTAPMIPCQVNHNAASQQLLTYTGVANGGRTTAGAPARQHLEEALDNIFNHPNLPPFISKQLIQHFVTSNPSPEYVARVVAVFKDDGSAAHARGNLRAVIRTILADPEARALPTSLDYGRLRAPAELIARVLRGLAVSVDTSAGKDPGGYANALSNLLHQHVPRPPSVFSYYAPDQPAPGTELLGPEFGLLDSNTITARLTVLQTILPGAFITAKGLDLDASLPLMPDTNPELIDWIDKYFLYGKMSTGPGTLRELLTNTLTSWGTRDVTWKKRLALTLTFMSPEFQIQR